MRGHLIQGRWKMSARHWLLGIGLGVIGFAAVSTRAGAPGGTLIDFNGNPAGTIVDSEYLSQGVRISVQRTSPGPAVATLYNTRRTGNPDPDLQIPFAGGNLGNNGPGGNILIIPENNTDGNKDGLIDQPNDEGDRPSGQF